MNNFSCSGTIGEYGFDYTGANGKTPAYHKFTVSVSTDKKRTDGKNGYEYIHVKCTAWGVKAELIRKNFKTGDPIEVSGTLSINQWTDRNNNVHNDLQISSANVSFVPKGFNTVDTAPPAPDFSNNAPAPDFSNGGATNNHGIGGNNSITPDNFANDFNINSGDIPF